MSYYPPAPSRRTNVFRVAQRSREVQFVEGCAAAKPQGFAQEGVGEYRDHRPADNQILFDLTLIGPRRDIAPRDNILSWYHSSASG